MTLRRCLSCTTRFAVGLEGCPHCGSGDHIEAGTPTAWRCQTKDCTGLYRTRLSKCGRCHGTELREELHMPKITVGGGASNAADPEGPTIIGAEWADDPELVEGATTLSNADEGAATIGSDVAAVPVGEQDEVEPGAAPETAVGEMNLTQLRAECKRRDLPTSGNKQELQERLAANPEAGE